MTEVVVGTYHKKIALTKEGAAAIAKEMDEYCIPCSKMVACSPPLRVEVSTLFYFLCGIILLGCQTTT